MKKNNQIFNIPNSISITRILLCFPLIYFLGNIPNKLHYYDFKEYSFELIVVLLIIILMVLSDILDGVAARYFNNITDFGKLIDPVADKVMVSVALIALTQHYQSLYITIPTIIIISREIIVSALREWMAEVGERANVAVSQLGKIKTAAQMLAIIGLIWQYDSQMITLSFVLFYIATILTFVSMVQYLIAGWGALSQASE